MLINGIMVGSIVNIRASDGVHTLHFESRVVTLTDKDKQFVYDCIQRIAMKSFTVVELIKEDDIPVNFVSNTVKCVVTAQSDGKPYSWSNVRILKSKLPDTGDRHIIISNDDVEPFNRRAEFRLWLGYDGGIRKLDSKRIIKCTIKDISNHGGGFIVNKDTKISKGSIVELQFHEKIKNEIKSDWDDVLHKGNYRVVRIINMRNNKVLLGCESIDGESADINGFIVRKQREKLQLGGRAELYRKGTDADLV